MVDALIWCFGLQGQANEVLQTVNDLSMLLPEEFTMKVVVGWYPSANGMATKLMPVFFRVRDSAAY
jgi:hypothetical protein